MKPHRTFSLALCLSLVVSGTLADRQEKNGNEGQEQAEEPRPMSAATFAGLKLRGIGPALMSGRIVTGIRFSSTMSVMYRKHLRISDGWRGASKKAVCDPCR